MKIYLLGICGTAMGSLAGLLQKMGHHVCGSDSAPYPPMSEKLRELNIEVFAPYSAKNLPQNIDLAIIGNVIRKDNPEVQAIFSRSLEYISLPQALERFILNQCDNFVVAGTHGKTTTSSMLAYTLRFFDQGCGYLIGGIPHDLPHSFELPKSKNFVIEGDEYDTVFYDKVPKFKYYKPRYVILTSIEYDHADIYPNLEAVIAAFQILSEVIDDDGVLVYNANDQNIQKILSLFGRVTCLPYGINTNLFFRRQKYFYQDLKLSLKVSGEYNYENASAVITLLSYLGFDKEAIINRLCQFNGVKRRLEFIGYRHGIEIYEDFAHHPTAVQKTYQALKSKYPSKKVICLFEPRSATSRRKIFQQQYFDAMKNFDMVVIQNAFDQSNIDLSERFSSLELVEQLKKHTQAFFTQSNEEILTIIDQHATKNDVIVVMSNGAFNNIYRELIT